MLKQEISRLLSCCSRCRKYKMDTLSRGGGDRMEVFDKANYSKQVENLEAKVKQLEELGGAGEGAGGECR